MKRVLADTQRPERGPLAATGDSAVAPRPLIPFSAAGLAVRGVCAVAILLLANVATMGLIALGFSLLGPNEIRGALWMSGCYVLAAILVVALLAAWLRWVDRDSIKAILAAPQHSGGIVGGVCAGAALASVGLIPRCLLAAAVAPAPAQAAGAVGQTGLAGWVVMAVFLLARGVALQALPEELLFRGWLLRLGKNRPATALVVTTLWFMVIHLVSQGGQDGWGQRLIYLVLPLGIGLLAAVLVLNTGSVWWGVGVHGAFHLVMPVCQLVWGFDQGPVSWVIMGLSLVAVAAVVLWITPRAWWRRTRGEGFSSQAAQV